MCLWKMKFLASLLQKLQPEQIHRQINRHTDSTEIITYPHTRMVKIVVSKHNCADIQKINHSYSLNESFLQFRIWGITQKISLRRNDVY